MQQLHRHVMLIIIMIMNLIEASGKPNGTAEVHIGVILDMDSSLGKVATICINMAVHDFYQTHKHYTTKIVPHFRDSRHDRVQAASAAVELIKDVQVMAIIGPQRSSQQDFVVDIGNKAKVPILSLATHPSLSPNHNPYFIRVSHDSSAQAHRISALIRSIHWREVVIVYQDGDFGTGFIPSLSQAFVNAGVQINRRVIISPFASDDAISDDLQSLQTNQTRVFVVHLLPKLASRFFKKAKQAGMMQEGYAWIVTDVVTSLLHTVNDTAESMQGVVGVKPCIPASDDLQEFEKRFTRLNPNQVVNVYGLWAYDATYALAMALERVGGATTFQQQQQPPVTDLDAIGISRLGPRLLSGLVNKTKFKGLSGDFSLVDRQLQVSGDYQIVNIVGLGQQSWNWKSISDVQEIIWPGGSKDPPRGWEIPGGSLRVGYPAINGFPEFINSTTAAKPTGFCVDVFEAVMEGMRLPHPPSYQYVQYPIHKNSTADYNDLVYKIHLKEYDVVIGDVTIRAERSKYVDFTLPYTESGVSMVVPIKKDDRKNAWIFMRPLEMQLWLTACGFFIYTGVVVWVLEHRVNKEFRGRPYKQVGMIFWFSFSTLVFAHKEKMVSNFSRFVVIVWICVVIVLQSSYIASLTSILTVQQLQPDFTDIHDLMRLGNNVGYKQGSFVAQMLKDMGFQADNLKGYGSLEEYDEALSNGVVSAIFDELPYVKLFLVKHDKHCNKYMIAGPTYKSAGFGFAFPKESPLLPYVSKALLQVTENSKLANISDKWFNKTAECDEQCDEQQEGVSSGSGFRSGRLTLDSFWGLFLIAGASSTCALIIYLLIFLYENKDMLLSDGSIRQKLSAIAKTFHQEKQVETTKQDFHDDDDDDDFLVIEDNVHNPPPTPENEQSFHDESPPPVVHDIVETRIQQR